jgi:hypothetical protein
LLAASPRRSLGERRSNEVLAFAASHCRMATDLTKAAAVLGDLSRLTGRRYDEQRFAERALELMLTHWPAVTALASALIETKRIEGDQVEQIIDHSMEFS